jgi:hypothetical protein
LPVSSIAFSKPTFSKLPPVSTSLFLVVGTYTANIKIIYLWPCEQKTYAQFRLALE